jgi:hypothetical protein
MFDACSLPTLTGTRPSIKGRAVFVGGADRCRLRIDDIQNGASRHHRVEPQREKKLLTHSFGFGRRGPVAKGFDSRQGPIHKLHNSINMLRPILAPVGESRCLAKSIGRAAAKRAVGEVVPRVLNDGEHPIGVRVVDAVGQLLEKVVDEFLKCARIGCLVDDLLELICRSVGKRRAHHLADVKPHDSHVVDG